MEQVTCPFDGQCPQVLNNGNDIKLLSNKFDMQQTYIIDKITDIGTDVKDMKTFLNEKLDEKIDARIESKLNEKTAKMSRWVITTILGSGGLTVLLNLLLNK